MRALRAALARLSPSEVLTVEKMVALLLQTDYCGKLVLDCHHGKILAFEAGQVLRVPLNVPLRESPTTVRRVEDLTTGKP